MLIVSLRERLEWIDSLSSFAIRKKIFKKDERKKNTFRIFFNSMIQFQVNV